MQKVIGSKGAVPLLCANPKKDKWKVRWNFNDNEDGTVSYCEQDMDHRPTLDEIKALVIGWYNSLVDEQIVSGFSWNGKPVWLSAENQMNFKAAYDIARDTSGATLPVKFKLGEDADGKPVYHTFTKLEPLADFISRAFAYINQKLNEGWRLKDSIDFSIYEAENL